MMTRHLLSFAFATLTFSIFLAGSVGAVTLTPNGTYEATNVKTGGNYHTFYLPHLVNGNAHYQFEGGSGTFVVTDNSARLFGTIVQNGNSANKLEADIWFNFEQTGPGSGIVGKTNKVPNPKGPIIADWDFFTYDLTKTSLKGASSSLLDGVELSLSVKPGDGSMPFQLGSYADDKGNAGLGGSSWFYWTVSSGENDPDLKNKNGHGDINVQLQPVPLPAGSLLLITALGACAVARRRKA